MLFVRQQKMQRSKLAGANHKQTKSFWKQNCKTHTSLARLSNLTQSLHGQPTANPKPSHYSSRPGAANSTPTNPKQAHRSHRDETDCATPRRRPRQRRPHPRLSNPMCSLLLHPALPQTMPIHLPPPSPPPTWRSSPERCRGPACPPAGPWAGSGCPPGRAGLRSPMTRRTISGWIGLRRTRTTGWIIRMELFNSDCPRTGCVWI
ncbi:uncharacterized protein LOC125480121 [Pyrus x bretschneideri]|uniref:uncharacterized protein LOC125480121 n=1 Tax=Pyrus x bretschneideri TaxID=225117 RepID=UPI00202DE927|nr:uncharacterized protein LOC125480121 [Pyrus x bretschneideri]